MTKTNILIAQRLQKKDPSTKMTEMAKQSVNGHLSGFAGIFTPSELSQSEQDVIHNLLVDHSQNKETLSNDFAQLVSITCEIKAINNQGAILHGERIKRAHSLLTRYKDGAFSSWLIAAYGNRQTPYNFWQYYEFCESMPRLLRTKIELMPRQAVYTLASRQGALEKKQKIVEDFQGQTKEDLLKIIRTTFPLNTKDKRTPDFHESILKCLDKLQLQIHKDGKTLTKRQKESIIQQLQDLEDYLRN